MVQVQVNLNHTADNGRSGAGCGAWPPPGRAVGLELLPGSHPEVDLPGVAVIHGMGQAALLEVVDDGQLHLGAVPAVVALARDHAPVDVCMQTHGHLPRPLNLWSTGKCTEAVRHWAETPKSLMRTVSCSTFWRWLTVKALDGVLDPLVDLLHGLLRVLAVQVQHEAVDRALVPAGGTFFKPDLPSKLAPVSC